MIKVYFQKETWACKLSVYIIDRFRSNGKSYLLHFGKFNNSWDELSELEERPEPTFILSGMDANELLKSLADSISDMGVKTESDFKIQGKLEATEKHLEDMRKLVFNRKKLEPIRTGEGGK
jgi:hypothetical protein